MNPYQILGISPSASDDEVKKAYRTLSKKYHPDANIGNPHQAEYTEKFKEVQNAYKTIMDERKRGFKQQSYGSQTTGTGGYQYQGNDQEAYHVLNQIQNKTSMWFYLAAIAESGLGNNIRAQEYAQTALQMEPMNMQYILLLNQLQGTSRQYRQTSQQYGNPASMMNCCYSVLLLNCMMSCCCGGGYHYPILCC